MTSVSSLPAMLIAVTGGIGSGKSIVSNVLRHLGYPVYDCDVEARRLMDSSSEIRDKIAARIDSNCIVDGCIDRRRLAAIVFADPEALASLNGIVHGAVRAHLDDWRASQRGLCFVETAILYQSHIDRMVDSVWEVIAPVGLRVSRVMARSGLTSTEVKARINSQESYRPDRSHPLVHHIINDDITPVLPRVERLLGKIIRNQNKLHELFG